MEAHKIDEMLPVHLVGYEYLTNDSAHPACILCSTTYDPSSGDPKALPTLGWRETSQEVGSFLLKGAVLNEEL